MNKIKEFAVDLPNEIGLIPNYSFYYYSDNPLVLRRIAGKEPEDQEEKEERYRKMDKLVNTVNTVAAEKLTDKQFLVYYLYFKQRCRTAGIAQMLGVTPLSIRMHVFRVKKRLRVLVPHFLKYGPNTCKWGHKKTQKRCKTCDNITNKRQRARRKQEEK